MGIWDEMQTSVCSSDIMTIPGIFRHIKASTTLSSHSSLHLFLLLSSYFPDRSLILVLL